MTQSKSRINMVNYFCIFFPDVGKFAKYMMSHAYYPQLGMYETELQIRRGKRDNFLYYSLKTYVVTHQ